MHNKDKLGTTWELGTLDFITPEEHFLFFVCLVDNYVFLTISKKGAVKDLNSVL